MATNETTHIALTVGTNLRDARGSRGWTQKQVADQLGVTNRDVSRWENGKVEPGLTNRYRLADLFFDGDVSALYREQGVAA